MLRNGDGEAEGAVFGFDLRFALFSDLFDR